MKQIIMITLYAGLCVLGAWLTDLCLRRWIRRARKIRPCWLIPYILCSLLPVTGALLPDSPAKNVLQAAGNIWLGLYLYYGGALAVLLATAALLRRRRPGWYGGILCVSLAASVVLCGYGMYHARQPETVSYHLTLPKQTEGVDRLRIVLIADLHLGVNSSLVTTQRMVEQVNAAEPDVVVVAGDIFNSSYTGLSHPDQYSRALRAIQSKYGVYAICGNHDVVEPLLGGFAMTPVTKAFRSPEMETFFTESGFTILADETILLPGGIQLAGRVDGEKAGNGTSDRLSPEQLLSELDPDLPVVVLEHEPVEFRALAEAGADLILCGHTHAGQIFPGNLIVPFFNENPWGYIPLYGADTVVTAGVGYYGPPIRVGTNSEVTIIDLDFQ